MDMDLEARRTRKKELTAEDDRLYFVARAELEMYKFIYEEAKKSPVGRTGPITIYDPEKIKDFQDDEPRLMSLASALVKGWLRSLGHEDTRIFHAQLSAMLSIQRELEQMVFQDMLDTPT